MHIHHNCWEGKHICRVGQSYLSSRAINQPYPHSSPPLVRAASVCILPLHQTHCVKDLMQKQLCLKYSDMRHVVSVYNHFHVCYKNVLLESLKHMILTSLKVGISYLISYNFWIRIWIVWNSEVTEYFLKNGNQKDGTFTLSQKYLWDLSLSSWNVE